MLRVGLTGELGSGKSTVAQMLAAHGAIVLSSDEMGRAMMQPGQAGVRPDRRTLRSAPSSTPTAPSTATPLAKLAFDSEQPSHRRAQRNHSPRRHRRAGREGRRDRTHATPCHRRRRVRAHLLHEAHARGKLALPLRLHRPRHRARRNKDRPLHPALCDPAQAMLISAMTPAAASKRSAPRSLLTSPATRSKTIAQ